MKKNYLLFMLTFAICFVLVGCTPKESEPSTPPVTAIEGNAKVGYLRFYAPDDYTYRPDLRGLAYSESEKKVYIKGDYENDSSNVIYLISAIEFNNRDAGEYVESINNKLTDNDVKYILKTNSKKQEVYVRENYIISGNINYAYIIGKSGDIYIVNVKGPQDKANEISKLAANVFESLYIQ